jgi:hypothetical protein
MHLRSSLNIGDNVGGGELRERAGAMYRGFAQPIPDHGSVACRCHRRHAPFLAKVEIKAINQTINRFFVGDWLNNSESFPSIDGAQNIEESRSHAKRLSAPRSLAQERVTPSGIHLI